MKIGIMGGTFDPVHKGHLMIADEAYHQFHLDEVWFLPNGNPPHKQQNHHRTDVKIRIRMLECAIKPYPYFSLDLYEANRTGISYSYETMEWMKKAYPQHTFYFIIGADSLFALETWVKPERILKTCTLLAAYRDEKDTVEEMEEQISYIRKKFNADVELLKTPLFPMSSTQIREDIRRGISVEKDLPAEVLSVIRKEHLYAGASDQTA